MCAQRPAARQLSGGPTTPHKVTAEISSTGEVGIVLSSGSGRAVEKIDPCFKPKTVRKSTSGEHAPGRPGLELAGTSGLAGPPTSVGEMK